MSYKLLLSPNFSPKQLLAWQKFNLVLQKITAEKIRLDFTTNYEDYAEKLEKKPDLVYASPYDAVQLLRQQEYKPLLRPTFTADEVVIFTKQQNNIRKIEEINNLYTAACVRDFFIERVGLILLEPSEMGKDDLEWESYNEAASVFRRVLDEGRIIGVVRAEVFECLNKRTKSLFKPIIKSSLYTLFHTLLSSKDSAVLHSKILTKLDELNANKEVLEAIKIPKGFKAMNSNHANFFSDLMDTLC